MPSQPVCMSEISITEMIVAALLAITFMLLVIGLATSIAVIGGYSVVFILAQLGVLEFSHMAGLACGGIILALMFLLGGE